MLSRVECRLDRVQRRTDVYARRRRYRNAVDRERVAPRRRAGHFEQHLRRFGNAGDVGRGGRLTGDRADISNDDVIDDAVTNTFVGVVVVRERRRVTEFRSREQTRCIRKRLARRTDGDGLRDEPVVASEPQRDRCAVR